MKSHIVRKLVQIVVLLSLLIVSLGVESCNRTQQNPGRLRFAVTENQAFLAGQCLPVGVDGSELHVSLDVQVSSSRSEDRFYADDTCTSPAHTLSLAPASETTLYWQVAAPATAAVDEVTLTLAVVNGSAIDPVTATVLAKGRAREVALGEAHGCAIVEGHSVQCWGDNSFGALGSLPGFFGAVEKTPIPVDGIRGSVTSITARGSRTCAIVDGAALCWGDNEDDLFGAEHPGRIYQPVTIAGLNANVQSLGLGSGHLCAVVDTEVRCLGDNRHGQVGVSGTELVTSPVVVVGVPAASKVAAGATHSCAITEAGELYCWGTNESGELGSVSETGAPSRVDGLGGAVTRVSLGDRTTCAETNERLYCWGLGHGARPVEVAGAGLALSNGARASCRVSAAGAVECWGDNASGVLGIAPNELNASATLRRIESLSEGQAVVEVSSSTEAPFACAISVDGAVSCWGSSQLGQIASGDRLELPARSPVSVPELRTPITDVATSFNHTDSQTCVVMSGEVWCWGSNRRGQLGRGESSDRGLSHVPGRVEGLPGPAQAVSVGFQFACALSNGSVWCWGINESGTLGDGTYTDSATPVPVTGLESGVTALALGNRHACAVKNGGAYCWGWDTYGQLGNGAANDGENSATPVLVSGLGEGSGVTKVVPGEDFTCALMNTGRVRCWGLNVWGQLGNGESGDGVRRNAPVEVSGIATATDIDTNHYGVCALVSGGRVQCWGFYMTAGQGPEVYDNATTPVTPVGLESGVTRIGGGGSAMCAVRGSELLCWGDNTRGQLGTGDFALPYQPTVVSDINASTIIGVQPGGISFRGFTCAASRTSVWCWGDNSYRQIGQPVPAWDHTPHGIETWGSP